MNNICQQHDNFLMMYEYYLRRILDQDLRQAHCPQHSLQKSYGTVTYSPPATCSSPVSCSGDHFAQFGAVGEPRKVVEKEFDRGAITLENGEVVYGTENIFTADRVHDLVKTEREGKAPRVVSNKVFVGGITHSMNRETINSFFAQFGNVFVDWPVKGPRINPRGKQIPMSSYSYLFLVYQHEESVLRLMEACRNPAENVYYVGVPGYREMIQIRPWFVKNAFYIAEGAVHTKCIDVHRTVFVGGLPRIVTASEIAKMFSEFGKVLLVTIDIDQDYGYPKGAARVVFQSDKSFKLALEKRYMKFNNIDSSKTTIEIKPYVMEDVGCDQCGGLWFNPFLDIYEQLKACEPIEKPKKPSFSLDNVWTPRSDELDGFDMWKCSPEKENPQYFPPRDYYPTENDKMHVVNGARKFVELAHKFLDDGKDQKVRVSGVEFDIGPDLWQHFLPAPYYETRFEPVQIRIEQQIENYLRLEHTNVYSNKSSYCKEAPCRQYYCPSCSNKLHSGPNQHVLMPAGKPERRPRKDKNMYLVTPQ